MNVFLITYDLIQPGQNYSDLTDQIKSLADGGWVKPCESFYLIKTSHTASTVRDKLGAIDATDKLLVSKISRPWAARGLSTEVVDWMKANL